MKAVVVLVSFVLIASTTTALDLGSRAPAKPTSSTIAPPADPAMLRQGGDTILSATPIDIPHEGTGTTIGYNDDYDEVCPYPWSTSPDVVYTFVADLDMNIYIDLFGSSYDTKIYLYDENLALIACNDDYYADYTSLLQWVPVQGGVQYYLVIDGYGGESGDYYLRMGEEMWWVPGCPPDGQVENEPPLAIDYVDLWNGGCLADPDDPPFQALTGPMFCGVSGWYLYQGSNFRDTDWFTIQLPASGQVSIEGYAWFACSMFELAPQDCGSVAVVQSVAVGPGHHDSIMTVTGEPGATVWFWFGPQSFVAPNGHTVYEFDYVLELSLPIGVERHSWSSVKALFG